MADDFFADDFFAEVLTAGRLACVFAIAGRPELELFLPAAAERDVGPCFAAVLASDFLATVFLPDVFPAVSLVAIPFVTDPFLAEPFVADVFLAGPFLADAEPLDRSAGPLRFPLLLPPDFPRDFLPRVAMFHFLGVGGENQHGR